jgi:hypothetical protein
LVSSYSRTVAPPRAHARMPCYLLARTSAWPTVDNQRNV